MQSLQTFLKRIHHEKGSLICEFCTRRRQISSSVVFPPLKQLLVHVLGLREFKSSSWGIGGILQPLLTGCYWTRTGGGVDLHHYWGSLATEVGLLHHPEATHLLFAVIEDVAPWAVGQFPIMFSYLRGPPRYFLKDEMVGAKVLSNLEDMRMPPYPNDGLPHRSWCVTEKKKNMTLWLEYSCHSYFVVSLCSWIF